MLNTLSEIEMNKISKWINNQEGQNYPCSNQIIRCGFFGTKSQWEKFCTQNKK